MFLFNQAFRCSSASPEQMDGLWAQGWRHFGTLFFRYETAWHADRPFTVMPLRVALSQFAPSRSQRRIAARNRDVEVAIRAAAIDENKQRLFDRHRQRFKESVPTSIYEFLSERPASVPCPNWEICVYLGGRLVAVSFLDIGQTATSAVYAMFDPAESRRSLGIFTMLVAISHSRERGCRYYYPGYAYRERSVYDYKKNFAGLEYLDWHGGWRPLADEQQRAEVQTR